MKYNHHYLIRIQYLGFRYSGWQHQPDQKTVEGMLHKTLKFILNKAVFKVVGAGRTDAKVSALDGGFELYLCEEGIPNFEDFIVLFNKNAPPDIRITAIQEVSSTFNIIKDAQDKTYCYLFSFGAKNHPFAAPTMANFQENLNIAQMIDSCTLFTGEHNFSNFTVRNKSDQKNTLRTLKTCSITPNKELSASFYPKDSYILTVSGKGFLRYQVRLIMGALVLLGKNEIDSDYIQKALTGDPKYPIAYVAPGSGLFLKELLFNI